MGSLLAGFTTRGRAFIAAGVAAGILGLALGQRTLLSIGGLLVILPVLSVLAASRTPCGALPLSLLFQNYDRLWSILVTGFFRSSSECPCLGAGRLATIGEASAAGAVARGPRSRREPAPGAAG